MSGGSIRLSGERVRLIEREALVHEHLVERTQTSSDPQAERSSKEPEARTFFPALSGLNRPVIV